MFSHILNPYDVLLLTTAVLAVVLALPLLFKRDRQINDLLLALFVLTQGFYAFYVVMLYNENIGPHTKALLFPFYKLPHMLILGVQGLLLLWYARAMMGRPIAINSPTTFIVIGLTVITACLNLLAVTGSFNEVFVVFMCHWLLNVSAVLIGFKALHQLQGYELRLPFIHSNLTKHSLTWLRVIAFGFVSVWVMTVLAISIDTLGANDVAEVFYLSRHVPPLILISGMVVYSQSHAISAEEVFSESDDSKGDSDAQRVDPELTAHLVDLMERIKVYQDPELRLEGLADSLDISPRNLSNILNRHYKKNFYDFVNFYRVMDAQSQLKSPENQEKPIQRVFEDAGFNSKTTFNTLFKKYTGQTPSAFRKGNIQYPMEVNQA